MTIERPMFPPREESSAKIINFKSWNKPQPAAKSRSSTKTLTGLPPRESSREERSHQIGDGLTETCKNFRLRESRRDVWRTADARRDYWHARLKFEDAIASVQNHDTPEGRSHPPHDHDDRWEILATYREAFARQLLTPAPDTAAIAWKRAALNTGKHQYTGITIERLERAIASDVEFLATHPTRRSNSEAMARSREFKDAMRQRIRDIAASRDLSDEEIKPVLRLKHREIGEFTEKHGVNLQWLLEGRGRIFQKDQQDLAAVVTTMPMADQQAIRATIREILQERDQ
jgi:hypothetical protein